MKFSWPAALLFMLFASSVWAAPAPAHRANLDFEVLQHEIRPDPDDPTKKRLHLTVQYRGERLITAWRIGCVIGSSHGYPGSSATGIDGYRLMEGTSPRVDPWEDEALIAPGEVIQDSSGISIPQDGPYGIQICGVLAVIRDDLSWGGDPEIVDRMFQQRAVDIVAVEPVLAIVEPLLQQPLLPPREEIATRLEAVLADSRTTRIRQLILANLGLLRRAEASPEEILRQLYQELEVLRTRALHQIRPGDVHTARRELEAEVKP